MNESIPEGFQKIMTKDGKVLYVKVDREACIGAGSCEVLAANTFKLDDQGIAYLVQENNYDVLSDILAGAQSCPVFAIILLDENQKQIWPEM